MTRFIAMLILLWLSGTKPAVSKKYAYTQMLIRVFFCLFLPESGIEIILSHTFQKEGDGVLG